MTRHRRVYRSMPLPRAFMIQSSENQFQFLKEAAACQSYILHAAFQKQKSSWICNSPLWHTAQFSPHMKKLCGKVYGTVFSTKSHAMLFLWSTRLWFAKFRSQLNCINMCNYYYNQSCNSIYIEICMVLVTFGNWEAPPVLLPQHKKLSITWAAS